MSLLSAVLKVADESNRSELKIKFKDISRRTSLFVDGVKSFAIDVKEILVSRYVDYLPVKSLDYINFKGRKMKLQLELDELQIMVDTFATTISASDKNFRTLYEDFIVTGGRFRSISDLGDCCIEYETSCRFIERRRYKEASELLEKLLNILNRPVTQNDLSDLTYSMNDIISLKHAQCLYKIIEQWRERLKWSTADSNKGNIILVEINISDRENLQDILNALSISKRINVELAIFADFFVKVIAPVLITKRCDINVTEKLNKISLEIVYKAHDKSSVDFKDVLKNLVLFFETVQMNIDCIWEDDRSVFSILGQIAGKQFFNILKEKCLDSLIPTDECQVDSYLLIIEEVKKFSMFLCELRFTDEETSPLTEFFNNAHILICDKKCQKLLDKARSLMKTNLQENIIEVCFKQSPVLCVDEIKMLEKDDYQERDITDSPYLLPKCSISLSAKKILQLVVDELDQAQKSSPYLANKVIVAVRNVFELYYLLVPRFHEDVLNENAIDLALFYNNCFYLAHGMLGHPWSRVFRKEFATNINLVLSDQIHNMRLAAIVKFSNFIRKQRQSMKEAISDSELNNLANIESLGVESETTISICLEKLNKLGCKWKPILPADTYEKTMANLISCLSKELVDVLLTVKDKSIGEDLARSISNVYQPVLDAVPLLFDENMDADKLSRHWMRLVEFASLLQCPMFSIANAWKEESGRLPKLFTRDEIRHFVRIVFPGSAQKSTVLSMIQ